MLFPPKNLNWNVNAYCPSCVIDLKKNVKGKFLRQKNYAKITINGDVGMGEFL